MIDEINVREAIQVAQAVYKLRKYLRLSLAASRVYRLDGCLLRGDVVATDHADGPVGDSGLAHAQCPSTSAELASVSFPERYRSRAAATVDAAVLNILMPAAERTRNALGPQLPVSTASTLTYVIGRSPGIPTYVFTFHYFSGSDSISSNRFLISPRALSKYSVWLFNTSTSCCFVMA